MIVESFQTDQADHLAQLLLALVVVIEVPESKRDVFAHRLPREESILLIYHPQSAGQRDCSRSGPVKA
jgi:hypothetical protein